MILQACLICGKEFNARPLAVRKGAGKYCSRKCFYVSMRNSVVRVCLNCGKDFMVYRSEVKRGMGKYCSRKCSQISRRNNKWNSITVTCLVCKKDFVIPQSRTKFGQGKYCSRRCFYAARTFRRTGVRVAKPPKRTGVRSKYADRRNLANRQNLVTMACLNCGKEIFILPSKVKQGHGKYCSNICVGKAHSGKNHHNWQGGAGDFRGYNWDKQRKAALERDSYTCQKCGTEIGLIVHHIIPYRLFGGNSEKANSLENLITLCNICHPKVDNKTVYRWNIFALFILMLVGSFSEKKEGQI